MSNQSNLHLLGRLFQPSFLSVSVTTVASLAVVAVLLVPSLYKNSEFAQYFNLTELQKTSTYDDYQLISDRLNNSEVAADSSVFIIWMIIGLLSYTVVASIAKLIASGVRFVQDVEYFKADRERIAREAIVHLIIRLVAAVGLYCFYLLLVPYVAAYVLAFARAALGGSLLEGVWYIVLMSLIVAASIHVVVILLRLVLLRVRVFFNRYDSDEV